MIDVGRDHVLQMAAAEDQESVEAFAADASNPSFGVRACLRRTHRGLDHPDPAGAEDLVEVPRELAVPVPDEEPGLYALVIESHQPVASLLGDPRAVRVARD